jgi:hypothetical protein
MSPVFRFFGLKMVVMFGSSYARELFFYQRQHQKYEKPITCDKRTLGTYHDSIFSQYVTENRDPVPVCSVASLQPVYTVAEIMFGHLVV